MCYQNVNSRAGSFFNAYYRILEATYAQPINKQMD